MSADLPANEPSDRELLQRFQNGEQLAATALYLRDAPRLLALAESRRSPGLAHRLDSEDIVQSVFRRFFRRGARAAMMCRPGPNCGACCS